MRIIVTDGTEKSWADKYGQLTVAEAIELNKAAKWYCGHEVVSDCEQNT